MINLSCTNVPSVSGGNGSPWYDTTGDAFGIIGNGILWPMDVYAAGALARGGIRLGISALSDRAAAIAEETVTGPRTFSLTDQILNCFVADTEVVVNSGDVLTGVWQLEDIQDIKIGDYVETRDHYNPNAPLERKLVTAVYKHIVRKLRILVIRGSNGKVETLKTTDGHPFWMEGRGWVAAGDLRPGDHIKQANGQDADIVATTNEDHPEGVAVYNFTVEGDHTYFVTQGGEPIWVHNICTPMSLLRNTQGRYLAKVYSVYYGIIDETEVYVGITRQTLGARLAQHAGRFEELVPIIDGLTRRQARAIEQVLIERNTGFLNEINSIAEGRTWYKDAIKWAKDFTKLKGI